MTQPTKTVLARTLGSGLLLLAATAFAQPLDRTPTSYLLLSRNGANLKDFDVVTPGPGCNIGVNNAGGYLNNTANGFMMAADTQVVADDCTGAGGTVAQCFCNLNGSFNVACSPWATPVLADETDATFIAACDTLPGGNFPQPCTPGAQDVKAPKNGDCIPLAVDTQTGNGRCNLAPGSYRTLQVDKQATLVLDGAYTVQSYKASKITTLQVDGPSTLDVCGNADLQFGDRGSIISECDDLRVNYAGNGQVNLGNKQGDIFMHLCAPFGQLRLRRKNSIGGNYFADVTTSDHANLGKCCGQVSNMGNCGCFDTVDPTALQVGQALTLTAGCNLLNITQVLVCGKDCPITMQTAGEIVCTVPDPGVALPTDCPISGVSGTGRFDGNQTVTVNP